jgi:GH24 family phage-related lysozyme (muramidase)
MKIKALHDTKLKKNYLQSKPGDVLVTVKAGKEYPIDSVLQKKNNHTQVQIGNKAGIWWIYDPHWLVDAKAEVVPLWLVKKWENLHKKRADGRIEAYPDPADGWNTPTIGWGTTVYPNGVTVKRGDIRTVAECIEYLNDYTYRKAIPVLSKIPTWNQLNQNQKAAVISFAYNLGFHFYDAPTGFNSIQKLLKNPQYWKNRDYVHRVFGLYIKARGNSAKTKQGLINRRKDEANVFLS